MDEIKRFENHAHTAMGSNIRLIDSINTIDGLLTTAYSKGYAGLAFTDHEFVGNAVKVLLAEKELKEKGKISKDFKVGLGNEIYLTDTRDKTQIEKYFHFLLIAKNAHGHEALRKLSSIAWYNSFEDRRMCRVPTLKKELAQIVAEYPNTLIATTACIGGETAYAFEKKDWPRLNAFMDYCLKLFGDDFYLEMAPAEYPDQIRYNKFLLELSKERGIKLTIGTDAHYATENDRYMHKSFLNSKDGARETDDFYAYTYLMSNEEVAKHMPYLSPEILYQCFQNSVEIMNKIEGYDIFRKQIIPKEPLPKYSKGNYPYITKDSYPQLRAYLDDSDVQNCYWANECMSTMEREGWNKKPVYMQRLEEEAEVLATISEKLEDDMTAYHNTLKQYIDMFWECGSIVGPGRGSSCGFLSNRCLGITQLDPVQWHLPYWRYLNKERIEIGDIDIDLCPSVRPKILKKIRERKGQDIRVLQVATFGSEKSKSAVLTSCRGYRLQDEEGKELYPDGINSDEALYIASFIPSERGFLWTLTECFEGDESKDRKPIRAMIEEVEKFPALKEIMLTIEGLITRRGVHASGVILYNDDPWKTNAVMRAPDGSLTTQFELHDSEKLGDTKFDFLLTDVSDRIKTTLEFLQDYGLVEKDFTLRQLYNKYLHPDAIDIKNHVIWDALGRTEVLNIFQFNDGVGRDTAQLIKPQDPNEMTICNALMRLMAEKGEQRPLDRYKEMRDHPGQWKQEAAQMGCSDKEIAILEPYYEECSGVPAYQETLMEILMDKNISHFTLTEANSARKVVAKKQMSKIPELKEKIFDNCPHQELAEFVWRTAIHPQLGYSFSVCHSLPYSFVGVQTIILGKFFPAIFWNTANLIIDSQGLDLMEINNFSEDVDAPRPDAAIPDDSIDMLDKTKETTYEGQEDEDEETNLDDPFAPIEVVKKKQKTINYGKVSAAIGKFQSWGVKILPPDINTSGYIFTPLPEQNAIACGLRGITRISIDLVKEIVGKRPYTSLDDFLEKNNVNKTQAISLIKAGTFDSLYSSREEALRHYLSIIVKKAKVITLATVPTLIARDLFPQEYEFQKIVYSFNKALKQRITKGCYPMNNKMLDFYCSNFDVDQLATENSIPIKAWEKQYNKAMEPLRQYLKAHTTELLAALNQSYMDEAWESCAAGSISKWEMDSLSFYYHDHELKNIDTQKYNIDNFFALAEEPPVKTEFKTKEGYMVKTYVLSNIAGTVLDRNKTKHTVTLLTTDGVVQVKVWNAQFAKYDRRISEVGEDGKKHVMEPSWFTRGNLLYIQGMRRGNYFIPKAYKSSPHKCPIMKITAVDGSTFLYTDKRYDE